MTDFPPSPLVERRRLLLRRIGMGLSGLMVLTVLVIFGLILRSESAHDEASCPFAPRSEKSLGSARVVEEARSCLPEVEEHRWMVHREGKTPYELGRKRLDKARFAAGRYQWKLSADEQQRLVLSIEVGGAPLSEFHEADALPR